MAIDGLYPVALLGAAHNSLSREAANRRDWHLRLGYLTVLAAIPLLFVSAAALKTGSSIALSIGAGLLASGAMTFLFGERVVRRSAPLPRTTHSGHERLESKPDWRARVHADRAWAHARGQAELEMELGGIVDVLYWPGETAYGTDDDVS